MKKLMLCLLIVLLASGLTPKAKKAVRPLPEKIAPFTISSPAFKQSDLIPVKYTCDGDNINPPLLISNVPSKAKSLALFVDDPDAVSGTFTHWVVFNISPKIQVVAPEQVPGNGINGANGAGSAKYIGPCPPSGKVHHYHFTLLALDTSLSLKEGATRKDVIMAARHHIIGQAALIGLYQR